jgi:hypothetical protein
MDTKYTYGEEDITIDMMFKIEHIASIIAKQENKDFDTVFAEFVASKTYKALQNTSNALWAESSEFIADDYHREKIISAP